MQNYKTKMSSSLLNTLVMAMMMVNLASTQLLHFQMVANKKTKTCLNEWFGKDETLALTWNMDEHLTNILQNHKNKKDHEAMVHQIMESLTIELQGNNNNTLKVFHSKLNGSFAFVTDEYQVFTMCVQNSSKDPIIVGIF